MYIRPFRERTEQGVGAGRASQEEKRFLNSWVHRGLTKTRLPLLQILTFHSSQKKKQKYTHKSPRFTALGPALGASPKE